MQPKTFAAIVLLVATSAGVGAGLATRMAPPSPPDHFERIGRVYGAELLAAYAGALNDGARELESPGRGVEIGVVTTGRAWSDARRTLWDARIAPELVRIVPEGTLDEQVTVDQRLEMAQAFRSIAAGLNSSAGH